MPLVIHPRVRQGFARLAALTAVGFFASTGIAAACSTPATTTPFASFGDTASYFLAPGGNFEGTSGFSWNLGNAAITPGNEPFQVGGPSDSQSLTINAGGSATSPTICVDNTMPSFRFFAHEAAPGSDLTVQVFWKQSTGALSNLTSGAVSSTQVADLSDGTLAQWAATGSLNLAGLLNLNPYSSYSVQLKFSVPQSAGAWQIDDVYIDPYRVA